MAHSEAPLHWFKCLHSFLMDTTGVLKIKLLTSSDLAALPPINWRIKDVLPTQGLAVMYGKSGAGKSFLALDMAAAIASGQDWFGYRVKQAPVVYVAGEGSAGFHNRVKAWEKVNNCPFPKDVFFVLDPVNIGRSEDLTSLVNLLPQNAVLILDTLNRVTAGFDENSPADMGRIIETASRLQAVFKGLVVFVHHPGKDASKGMRGHSAMPAAADGIIQVSKSGAYSSFQLEKVKDGQDGASHAFVLQEVPLGMDADGDDVTSCAVVPNTSILGGSKTPVPQGKHQQTALAVIKRKLAQAGAIPDGSHPSLYPTGREALQLQDCLIAVADELDVPSDKRTSRARDAVDGLTKKGLIAQQDNWVWLP